MEAETDAARAGGISRVKGGPLLAPRGKDRIRGPVGSGGRGRATVVSSANQTPISIGLVAAAAISGQVSDPQGRALQGAKVVAIVRRSVHGESRFTALGEAGHTDDMGRYRLHGLPPGHYSAALGPFRRGCLGRRFSRRFTTPACRTPQAVFFELKPGETEASVNLTSAAPKRHPSPGRCPECRRARHRAAPPSRLPREAGCRFRIAAVLTDADAPSSSPMRLRRISTYGVGALCRMGSGRAAGAANARAAVRSVRCRGRRPGRF